MHGLPDLGGWLLRVGWSTTAHLKDSATTAALIGLAAVLNPWSADPARTDRVVEPGVG